jgi:1-acyl-sn-glycerol-3-phosphate acyltransferase
VLYRLLKIYARIAIKIYCRKVRVNKPALLKSRGPVLFAANHPNSFLDGIILTTLFEEPVHSLTRGDVFRNKWMNRFLRSLQLLPVYRTSEGVENLEYNYTTFDACLDAFRKEESVLIFSEGRCENEWHLRPLRKGTARLAIAAWESRIPLTVIPTAFNYSSFKRLGKEVHLLFGEPIPPDAIMAEDSSGKKLLAFNEALHNQLQQIVYEIGPGESEKRRQLFFIRKDYRFYLLLLPALMGWLLHAPLFYVCKSITHARFRRSGHYDSVLTTLIFFNYPFYLVLIFFLFYLLHPLFGWISLLLLPLTAWAVVQVKYQADI